MLFINGIVFLGDCISILFCFGRTRKELVDDGIEKSKKFLVCMFKHVQNALDMKQVISAGPFFYFVIQEVFIDFQFNLFTVIRAVNYSL